METRRTSGTIDRRSLLALGAMGVIAGRAWPWCGRQDELDALVRWILVTPRDHVLARAVRELRGGLTTSKLLAGCFVASVREICPSSAAFNHAALVVSSIDQLTASLPEAERAGPVLWCLDYFKSSEAEDARTSNWTLAAVDSARMPSAETARAELVRALDRWDADAADVCVASFVRSAPLDDVFELVWEYGTRCQANLGHKAIYSAMAHRSLALAGPRFAEDSLRSVVTSYFIHGKSERAEPFEKSRELVDKGLALDRDGAFDAGAAKELDQELSRAAPGDAPLVIAKALENQVNTSSAWDAIVAGNARLVVNDPSIGALHALTSVNALHYVARHARTDRVRLLALLQAAAWSCSFRIDSRANTGHANSTSPPTTAVDTALDLVRSKADDVHDFKIAAAAAEEAQLAGPYARASALAALNVHIPPPDRPEPDNRARIREALAVGR